MSPEQKIEQLQAALLWAFSESVNARNDHGKWKFMDGGCGCCAGYTDPPEELRAVIVEALEADAQRRGTTGAGT